MGQERRWGRGGQQVKVGTQGDGKGREGERRRGRGSGGLYSVDRE